MNYHTEQPHNRTFLEQLSTMSFVEIIHSFRNSRKLILLVVFIALFFDNMLLTTVVPIIPEYLFELEHPNASSEVELALKTKNLSYFERINAENLSQTIVNEFDYEDRMVLFFKFQMKEFT
jgi:hypothetical protein